MKEFEQGEGAPESRIAPGAIYTPLLRAYDDAPEIERVWARLNREQRSQGRGLGTRFALAAVVLLGLGFGLGRLSQPWALGPLAELGAPRQVAIAPETRAAAPSGPRAESPLSDEVKSRAREIPDAARPRPIPRPAPVSVPEETAEVVELAALNEPEAPSSWSRLAEKGEYAAAFEVLDETGELSRLVAAGSAEELMTLADVARFAGRTGWAIQILREVTSRHSEDENAPLAAMTLGNLLDRAGDREGAARAYALCRRLAPYGDFAEDALVREFMMACGAQERARASRLLSEYASLHPGGARQEEMTAALAVLGENESPAPEDESDILDEVPWEEPSDVPHGEPSLDSSPSAIGDDHP